jgi:diguanylate cyclase (GGDEF)-like protein/PAS domain S-box-containing protein
LTVSIDHFSGLCLTEYGEKLPAGVIGPRRIRGISVMLDAAHVSKADRWYGGPIMAALCGGPVLGVAVLIMLGWVMRVPWMVQVIPGTTAMVFSTALCLFLLAIALLLTAVPRRWCKPAQMLIGVGVLLVGVTVTVQYRLNVALFLDLPGMHAWFNGNPGRMAPNTALTFVLAGFTVLIAAHARPGARAVLALIGAFAVAMMGITGLIGYRLHPELLYGWHAEMRMALPTATAFLLIGIGYASVAYRTQGLGELFRQREDLRVGLLGGGLMVFVGVVGGLVAFTLLQEQMESVLQNGLRLSFNSRQDYLAAEIPQLIQATRDFTSRPGVERELKRLRVAPGDPAARQYVDVALRRYVSTGPVSGRLFDAHGRQLASAGSMLATVVELPLQQADNAVLSWSGQSANLHTAQPIASNGILLGRIELVYALPVLTHMVKGAQETNASGEMQLCAMAGPAVRCLPMRLAPQRTELPAATRHGPTLIARALASESGVGPGTDYRGERVIAVYGPVGKLGLGMVLKVDVAEIYAPMRQRFELTLLMIGLIITAGVLLLRARVVPLVRRLTLSERQSRGLLESAPDAMVVAGLDGRIVWVNSRAERLFGYAREELIGQSVELLVPEGQREAHVSKRNGYAREPHNQDIGKVRELYGRRRDGRLFPAEISLSPQETEEGMRVISTVRDISERKRAIQALRDSEQRWQFALEGARDGVWDWNLVTNELFFSRQWKAMLGYAEHEIVDSLEEWDKRVHPDDKARAYADIDKHLKGETPYYQNEHRLLCKDGTYKWILDRGMVVSRDASGKPTRMIGTHTDITERKQDEETIRELSLVDDLTGLRNRRGFLVLGESQLNLARRLGRTAVLYFADVDGLKRINDELGHAEGDRALADVAGVLRATFRETDIIARLSGDEFVVLALESPGIDPLVSAARLEEQLSQYNRATRRPFRLAVSMGVAQRGPESDESLPELLRRADADMYRIKQRRRAAS